jgi:hypothetical protein
MFFSVKNKGSLMEVLSSRIRAGNGVLYTSFYLPLDFYLTIIAFCCQLN